MAWIFNSRLKKILQKFHEQESARTTNYSYRSLTTDGKSDISTPMKSPWSQQPVGNKYCQVLHNFEDYPSYTVIIHVDPENIMEHLDGFSKAAQVMNMWIVYTVFNNQVISLQLREIGHPINN